MTSLGAMVPHPTQPDTLTYNSNRNPLLIPNLMAKTGMWWWVKRDTQDNSQHATPEAAQAFVDALNGLKLRSYETGDVQVYRLGEPQRGFGGGGFRLFGYAEWYVTNTEGAEIPAPKQMIQRPDGTQFAAGAIADIGGNEAVYANTRERDWAIYNLLGDVAPALTSISEALLSFGMAAVKA